MNKIVQVAQADVSNSSNENAADVPLIVTRPDAQQSIVSLLAPGRMVDFSQVLNDEISFIRIGDDLQMIFADGGTLIIQSFFAGDASAQIALVGDGKTLSIDEFTAIASLQSADEIQTAAGETTNLATALGAPQGSGQTFEDVTIGDLGDGLNIADLLTGGGPGGNDGLIDELTADLPDASPFVIDETVPDLQIVFLDDPSSRNPNVQFENVRVDETSDGEQHSDNAFDETAQDYDPDVVALFASVLTSAGGIGSDDDLLPFGPIYASDQIIDVDASNSTGADTSVLNSTLELVLVDSAGAASTGPVSSGLYTTGEVDTGPGAEIFLFAEGDLIVGRYDPNGGTADENDPAAFAITIDDEGSVSIAQYVSMWHDDPDSSDEDIAIGNDSLVDPGSVLAQLTVTYSDGSTASTRENISDRITFDDDGPDPIGPDFLDPVFIDEPDDLDLEVSGQLLFDPGADGATVTDATVFSDDDGFVIREDILQSNFPFVEGSDYLTVGGERVETVTVTSAIIGVITITGTTETSGESVFEIVIQPDGSFVFTQLAGFDHPDAGLTGDDDPIDIYLDFTVTDGDGDVEGDLTDPFGSEFFEIFRITDDGPSLTTETVSATVEEAGVPIIFDNPQPSTADSFGAAVTVIDNFLLVGSPRDGQGDVFLFDLTTGSLIHTIDGEAPDPNDPNGRPLSAPGTFAAQFGGSVAMEGDYILIGAQYDLRFNGGGGGRGPRQGEAHLFDANTGNLIASFESPPRVFNPSQPSLNNPTRSGNDQFGSDVAISGNLLLIGAAGVPDGGTRGGQAFLFDAENPDADPIIIRNPGASREDQFGSAVDIDGSYLVVSAPSNGTSAGEVHLFDTAGNFILSFVDPSPDTQDSFGSDVAIQGNLVVVGARREDGAEINSGEAYLYSFDAANGTSQLLHTFVDPEPVQNGFFGFSVAIDGNQVVIGASARDASVDENGRTYVFDATTGDLIQTLEDPTPSPFGRDDMGEAVSIDGNTIAVGAPGDSTLGNDVGQVYVFQSGTGAFNATLDLSSLVSFGNDGPASGGGFSFEIFDAQDFGTLTSGGTQVRIVSDGTTLTGFLDDGTTADDLDDGDTTVFTLTIDETNAEFILLGNLDHGTDDTIPLEFGPYIIATDADGDSVSLGNQVTINVANDDAPTITSDGGGDTAAINVKDQITAVTDVDATDPDGQTLTYAITGGADEALFSIDSSSGELSFIAPPNFVLGGDNDYEVEITVSDFGGQTDVQTINVTVTDPNDPIIIDLNGDGVGLTAPENGVDFDIDGDGVAEQIGWVGPDDGMLVLDIDGSGVIENGFEVFSEVFDGGSYADSLEALASLDENGDGVINAGDAAFDDIKIWQDANADGVSQEDELQSLIEHGISSIDLNAARTDLTLNGNTVFAEGTYTKVDGSTGAYAGVSFGAANEVSNDNEETTRQSTAIAAGTALVLYAASAEEVLAGLLSIDIKGDPPIGAVDIGEDLTVVYTPPVGHEGKDVVELELAFADGSTVMHSIELDVHTEASSIETTTTVVDTGDAVDPADQSTEAVSVPEAAAAVTVTGSVIEGDDSDNILIGTDGDDILIGGLGADTLTGGAGADTFVLNSLAEADLITDYTFGDGDKLHLGQLLENAFGTSTDATDFVRAHRDENGDVRVEVDQDGSQDDGHAWQEAAILQDHASMGETIRVVLDGQGVEAEIAVNVA